MKRAAFALLATLTLTSSALTAQDKDKPSFAGTWKLASEGGDMMTPPQMTVAQDAKTMTVTQSTQMGEIKTLYNLDGTQARSPLEFNGQSFDRVTKAAWDAGKLKLTVTSEFQGQTFETKATWTLNADGTLLVEMTRPDFQGGGAPVTTKATYKKG